jgi:hypothetical protein
MRAAGFSTYPYKLAAFTLSGGMAGLAGFLFAVKDGFVNPELMSWHLSGALLVMIILGGLGHLRGALIGAFAFALLQELFKSEAMWGPLRGTGTSAGPDHHRHRGAAAARPGGIAAAVARRPDGPQSRSRQAPESKRHEQAPARRAAALQRPDAPLGRPGGGQRRVLSPLQRGTVHAVIGTNGAGKSTLINMLSGELPPSAAASS